MELHLGYLLSRDPFGVLDHFGNFNGYRYRDPPFLAGRPLTSKKHVEELLADICANLKKNDNS